MYEGKVGEVGCCGYLSLVSPFDRLTIGSRKFEVHGRQVGTPRLIRMREWDEMMLYFGSDLMLSIALATVLEIFHKQSWWPSRSARIVLLIREPASACILPLSTLPTRFSGLCVRGELWA